MQGTVWIECHLFMGTQPAIGNEWLLFGAENVLIEGRLRAKWQIAPFHPTTSLVGLVWSRGVLESCSFGESRLFAIGFVYHSIRGLLTDHAQSSFGCRAKKEKYMATDNSCNVPGSGSASFDYKVIDRSCSDKNVSRLFPTCKCKFLKKSWHIV